MTREPSLLGFQLPPLMFSPDNPYMPRHLQQAPLNLDPGDFALLHPLLELPPSNIDLIDDAHRPIVTTTGPVHNDADKPEDMDDNSLEYLSSIEDHKFPSFFFLNVARPHVYTILLVLTTFLLMVMR